MPHALASVSTRVETCEVVQAVFVLSLLFGRDGDPRSAELEPGEDCGHHRLYRGLLQRPGDQTGGRPPPRPHVDVGASDKSR